MVRAHIHRIHDDGTGEGEAGGRPVRLWNALPGEVVEAEILKKRGDIFYGIATTIFQTSPYRIPAQEDHFLSCSPWQIMTYEEENATKKIFINKLFREKLAIDVEHYSFLAPSTCLRYRNKMEFSFALHGGTSSLAFFRRDGRGKIPLTSCFLAHDAVNEAAARIVDVLSLHNVSPDSLKSLIVRSNSRGETVAALFVKDAGFKLTEWGVQNLCVYYSLPQSPASVPTSLLYETGNTTLTERVCGKEFEYGVLNFFQVNIPIFETALHTIKRYTEGECVLDLYTGVGTIGIVLADTRNNIILADSDARAVQLARANAERNSLSGVESFAEPAERLLAQVTHDRLLVLDPPRGGLHPKLVQRILRIFPKRIIYLSCNPISQVRDISVLMPHYMITFQETYNFFPRTPHCESLCILDRALFSCN